MAAGVTRSPRGRTKKGRERAERITLAKSKGRPLLRGVDCGPPIVLRSEDVGAGKRNERWVEPFLEANRPVLERLRVRPEVAYQGETVIHLHPESRIGAVPLLSPVRRVACGLLIQPRFPWTDLGDVVGRLGFDVEPAIGGGPLVPGSAREVPAWLLAGPVLRRLESLLRNRRRTFEETRELRTAPRGRIDWAAYAAKQVPAGRWDHLPCTFSEPKDDPKLTANVRWTLGRVSTSLAAVAPSPIGRALLEQTQTLQLLAGPGPALRPSANTAFPFANPRLLEAMEAMGWVSEERGLGGAKMLDGLAWNLDVEHVWEKWVDLSLRALAPQLGLAPLSGRDTLQALQWHGAVHSMGALIPDVGLRSRDRIIWVDAKYKQHLRLLARQGWRNLPNHIRDSHRADLHQALAYAAMANVDNVDTILAYPQTHEDDDRPPSAIATLVNGRRRVRLLLASFPFGFRSADQQERAWGRWRELLSA